MSDNNSTRRTVWTCAIDGRQVRLEDIPARQLAELETRLGCSWLELVGRPLANSAWTLAMYEKCCALIGATPDEQITTRTLLDAFELVDDDRPDLYVGGLPDPKAADQTTAG